MDLVLKASFALFFIAFLAGQEVLSFLCVTCSLSVVQLPRARWIETCSHCSPRPAPLLPGASEPHLYPLLNDSPMIGSIHKPQMLLHVLSFFRTWTWILAHCWGRLLFSENGKVPPPSLFFKLLTWLIVQIPHICSNHLLDDGNSCFCCFCFLPLTSFYTCVLSGVYLLNNSPYSKL